MIATVAVVAIVVLGILLVGLVLLWAFTEELPRTQRVPFYERLEPGEWGVRVERVGRRKMRTLRLANEVLGGDLATAKAIADHPPAVLIEGISEPLARELVTALGDAGAEAVAYRSGIPEV
jgi:ribosomal protein L7/L12